MVLTGYPIEDLALRWSFQQASITALDSLAGQLADAGLGDVAVIVGYLDLRDGGRDHPLGTPRGAPINAAAVLHGGQVVARYAKHHLPNYGVFDEFRYFVSGTEPCVVRIHGVDVALAICEDLWQDGGPVAQVRGVDAGLLVVINGSPYEVHKDDSRLELAARRAVEAGAALAYVNMVGGQDELVFDGDSLVVDRTGALVARAPQFAEHLLVVDLELEAASGYCTAAMSEEPLAPYEPLPARAPGARLTDEAEMYGALVVGLRDYVIKNGFRSVTFGFSGGIDSALVAAIAADAIGAENVHGLSMPSRYSSQHSQDDAFDLAERLGAHCRLLPIAPMFDAYMSSMELTGLAEENLQARIRGTAVMAVSNQEGHLVLAPGNKSELSVGYSTHLRRRGRRVRPDQGRAQVLGVPAGQVAQCRGRAPGPGPPDPAELHHQAPVGRAAPGPGGHRLAARLRHARRHPRRVRRGRPGGRGAGRRRLRPGAWSSGSCG